MAAGEDACPVCGAPGAGGFPRVSRRWSAVECPGCGHAFVPGSGGGAARANAHFEGEAYVAWREEFAPHFEAAAAARASYVQARADRRPGKLLEIGCSTGEFLNAMAAAGWEAFGVDPSAAAVAAARRRYPRLRAVAGTEAALLERSEPDAAGIPARFDLIAAFHLIEHIREVDGLLSNCRRLAAPGGSLVIFTPHWGAWSRRLLGDAWPDFMPEHVHFFTARSLSLLLARYGFRTVHVATGGTSWTWLGGLARLAGRLRPRGSAGAAPLERRPPGRLKMRTLRAGDAILSPLLRLEGKLGGGSELRVVAQVAEPTP